MKKILILTTFCTFTFNAYAYETSECDGLSTWRKVQQNSPDVMVRTCNLFGMNYIEIKSQLNENRCIAIKNKNTGSEWKNFLLRSQSIKALANPNIEPAHLEIASTNAKPSGCKS
ncbi:hypothetical protein FD977_07325 [Polynucleobacter sp. AP-Elch-400A-B2]|uniref:hypothetical protein n=1 Tax=Polynucleobacter sp. AP-Elch-400A-B2 TaxID=2576930 RepID=UPI001BFE872E|nr:hypothetical protein [Polynucleobacter sp. AP-Elch-400A-B2]QWE24081.1 hypothetical protein FD977_07325 [Polynucleobacter sp. AP-Elch-400A-B2]